MIKTRFYHIGKAAMLAAFLIISLLAPSVGFASQSSVSVVRNNSSKKVKKTKMQTSSTFENPNFAFPETVGKDAMPQLEKAMAEKDGLAALKAAMQVIVSRNMISMSAFPENVNMLDSMSKVLPQPYASLCSLLEANLYSQLYASDRWNYMRRTLPLDTYPDDPKSWSGELFAKKILELVNVATSTLEPARSMPIKDIQPIIENEKEATLSGLTVWDFIVYNGASLLSYFYNSGAEQVIPFRKDAGKEAMTEGEKCRYRQVELIDGIVDSNRESGNIPALLVAVSQKAYLLKGEQRTKYLREQCIEYAGSPEDGRLLHEYFNCLNINSKYGESAVKELYSLMQDWLAGNLASRFSKSVSFDIARMQEKKMSLRLPSNVLPGDSIKGTINFDNMNTGYVLLYKVPASMLPKGGLNYSKFLSKSRLVKVVKVNAGGEIPFSASEEFNLPPLPTGNYVAIPSASPSLSRNWRKEVSVWSVATMTVSEIAVITSGDAGDARATRIYVVDARTQRPVEGAVVKFYDRKESKVVSTRVTNAEGFCGLLDGERLICVTKENDVKWERIHFYTHNRGERVDAYTNILTDLSIYRPGDEVQFSVVGWTRSGHDNKLLKDCKVMVRMRDANWNDIDTLSLVTDRYGRCDGKFTLPKDGLSGTFSIYTEFDGFQGRSYGQTTFRVEEYKAPGFFVSVEPDSETSYTAGDTVKFPGKVMTYSGMPLSDCKISYKVNWQPWWRWYDDGGNASYGGTASTDADGSFIIELPTANLKGTRYEHGIYSLEVFATSVSGETQNAPVSRFSLGNGLTVNPAIPGQIEVTGDSLKLNVPVYDMLGHPVVKTVEYSIRDDVSRKEILKGSFSSPQLTLVTSCLSSGKYKFQFRLPGDTVTADGTFVAYRKTDSRPPYPTSLWVPDERIICKEGVSTVDVTVGSGYAGSWILCEISDEKGFRTRRWIEVNDENVKVPVETPDRKSRIWVTFSGMHDLKHMIRTVNLIPESQTRRLQVKATSFRDRISAGDREKWKFSFKVDGEIQKGIPAIAVMSNKALNALAPFTWNFNVDEGGWWKRASLLYNTPGFINTSAIFSKLPAYSSVMSAIPEWNTYGYGFGPVSRYYRNRTIKLAAGGMTDSNMVEEVAETVEFAAAPVMMKKQEMRSAAQSVVADADDMVYAEAEKAEETVDGGMDNGGQVKTEDRPRPVEMPLAFFMPCLTSDDEGNVNIDFETPNFNTTWQFQIAGYTDELLTASLAMDAVASKPVMVQSNLPRYLRVGDNASVMALLFNNSTDILPLHGEIEVYDPLTGKVIVSRHFKVEEIAPSANRMIAVDFRVPSDVSALAVRAYAYGGDYSDGEQDAIPVLPSSTPVVESTQFYIGPGAATFCEKLPKFRKDANLTLKYCDNPMWECILALPSISNPESKNLTALMRALYGNSIALHVSSEYPAVREGIVKAVAARNTGDSTVLRSNLQKDAALKTVALINTPWVNNASAETQRMESLSGLLDKDAAQSSVDRIMADIVSLQNSDGGWSWCPDMSSSVFMTQRALLHFGMMKHIGCLPGNTSDMIKRGVAYCDREIYEKYVKSNHQFSTLSMLNYLYVRSFFDVGNGPSGFNLLKAKALKKISEGWAEFTVYDKATAATLLSRSKGYESIAPVILESLRQFASKSDAKGWWYDNLSSGWNGWTKLITTAQVLEAYAEIEPEAPAVDGLRQWLVLQKETEDWGGNPYTVEVIQSILSCDDDWTFTGGMPEISLDGKPLRIPSQEMLTGVLTLDINPKEASGKRLEIVKKSEGPAWGGVISQYVDPIKEVKAEACENLKIEKKIYVVTDSESGEEVRESDVKVGDKIRVTLTVTCDKDMNYVALIDERAACLEPDEQLSRYTVNDGLWLYREVRDSKTSFFIGFLPKGVNVISYDCHVDREGEYALGIASVQSQYSPAQVAHSSGGMIIVKTE